MPLFRCSVIVTISVTCIVYYTLIHGIVLLKAHKALTIRVDCVKLLKQLENWVIENPVILRCGHLWEVLLTLAWEALSYTYCSRRVLSLIFKLLIWLLDNTESLILRLNSSFPGMEERNGIWKLIFTLQVIKEVERHNTPSHCNLGMRYQWCDCSVLNLILQGSRTSGGHAFLFLPRSLQFQTSPLPLYFCHVITHAFKNCPDVLKREKRNIL